MTLQLIGSTFTTACNLTKDIKGLIVHVLSPDTTIAADELLHKSPYWKTIIFVDNTAFPVDAKNSTQISFLRKGMKNGSDVIYLPFSIEYFTTHFQSGIENYNTKHIDTKYSLVILPVDTQFEIEKHLEFFNARMPSGSALIVRRHFIYSNQVWKMVDYSDAFMTLIKI